MSSFLLKRTLLAASFLALLAPVPVHAASDKSLQRQRGTVTYRDPGGVEHGVAGQVVLPDDARAQTGRASLALLTLPDSSVVSLGENTDVQVGAFNAASSNRANEITLNGGALKFAVRHPQGGRSNYRFTTPTSQIAVRGTDGYLVVGPNGTQVVCTQCDPGDVQVTVLKTGVITALVTGQVLTILNSGAAVTSGVSTLASFNSPAVNQFTNGVNPFGNVAASTDVTGSASGATATAGAATGAAAGASIGAVAGGAVVAGAAVSAVGTSSTSTVTTLTITPASFNFSSIGQTQTFTASAPITSAVSTNPSVATVTGFSGSTLTVRAAGGGSASISVSAGSATANINITVTGAVVTPQRIHL